MAVSSKKIREYRNKYRDKEIKLSAEINTFLNIRSVVNITIDSYSTFGIIYSISMDSIKIIFDENDILSVLAKNKKFCSIRSKLIHCLALIMVLMITTIKYSGKKCP